MYTYIYILEKIKESNIQGKSSGRKGLAIECQKKGISLSEQMKIAILGCNPYFEEVEGKTIKLIVEHWSNHKFNGLDLKFMISSI